VSGADARRRPLGALLAVVLAAGLLAACAGPDETGSPAHRMAAWVQGTGLGATIATLDADAARVTTVVDEHHGTGAIHADCGVLYTDTEAANTQLPSPDVQLTTLLSDAYTEMGKAANNCFAAGGGNTALQRTSARQRTAARALLVRALRRAELVSGAPVPTTTTTSSPDSGGAFG